MEDIACAACGGREVRLIKEWRLSKKQGHAVACSECGLLFVHPQPAQNLLDEYYAPQGGWQASRTEQSRNPPQTRTKGAATSMFGALDRYLPVSTPPLGARVFDFGCGPGTWLNSFQNHGWDTYGLEPSSDAAFVRHKRLWSIPSEPQFHLVVVYHVLEHLRQPLDTLRELARTLLPGGHCFVSVPRIDTLATHRQADYCLHPRHHIVGFTELCLRGLLIRAELEPLATFHELDDRFSKGEPVRLRLLARKTSTPPPLDPDPAAALKPVIEAFVQLKRTAMSQKSD